MESIKEFTLIAGKFNAQDAKSILLNFYNTKIIFHNQQLLRMAEIGKDDGGLIEYKITELENSKNAIIGLLNATNNEGEILEIEGKISIKMLKDK